MDENDVWFLLLKDHRIIAKQLYELKKSIESGCEDCIEKLKKFKWSLERHFFIEEKFLYTDYTPIDSEDSEMINDVLRQHESVLKSLKELEKNMTSDSNTIKNSIKALQKELMEHKGFEDNILYPKLEDEFKDQKKRFLLEKLKEELLKSS